MALPNLTLRSLSPTVGTNKGSALTFAEMDTNLNNLAGANITVTAAGTTSNIALNSGFTITAGSGVSLTNSAGNVTITSNVAADTAPKLGGNLNVNNFSITGNVSNKGVRFDFNPAQTTTFLEYSAPQGGLTFFGGNNETTNVKFTANVNSGADVDFNILKLQNLSTGSLAETKMVLKDSSGNQELGLFKPSGTSGYSFAPVPSAVSGDAGIYNIGGNLKLYAADGSFNPTYITFQSFFANTASEPFKFNLGTGDLNSLGNINLATGKNVTINGVALTSYSNVQVATYLVANPPAGTYSNVQVASYLAGNITVGNVAGKTSGFTLGYLEMPQVAAANVTLALTDSGKHFYDTSTAVTTITIPANSVVAFPIGTVISAVNNSVANVVIAQGSATLYLGGNATTGSRTITQYGVATLMKVATDTWYINGSGVV